MARSQRGEAEPGQPGTGTVGPIEDEWLRDNLVAIVELAMTDG